ncbi:MAG: hypothetical protein V4487_00275 [Chlamydiota bacterium]
MSIFPRPVIEPQILFSEEPPLVQTNTNKIALQGIQKVFFHFNARGIQTKNLSIAYLSQRGREEVEKITFNLNTTINDVNAFTKILFKFNAKIVLSHITDVTPMDCFRELIAKDLSWLCKTKFLDSIEKNEKYINLKHRLGKFVTARKEPQPLNDTKNLLAIALLLTDLDILKGNTTISTNDSKNLALLILKLEKWTSHLLPRPESFSRAMDASRVPVNSPILDDYYVVSKTTPSIEPIKKQIAEVAAWLERTRLPKILTTNQNFINFENTFQACKIALEYANSADELEFGLLKSQISLLLNDPELF